MSKIFYWIEYTLCLIGLSWWSISYGLLPLLPIIGVFYSCGFFYFSKVMSGLEITKLHDVSKLKDRPYLVTGIWGILDFSLFITGVAFLTNLL